MSSPVEQEIETNYTALKDYLLEVETFLKDPSSGIRMFYDVVNELDNAQAISLAKERTKDNPGFASATAVDEAHSIDALYREKYMREHSKRDYYSGATSYVTREAAFLKDSKNKSIKYIKGEMPIQGNN